MVLPAEFELLNIDCIDCLVNHALFLGQVGANIYSLHRSTKCGLLIKTTIGGERTIDTTGVIPGRLDPTNPAGTCRTRTSRPESAFRS